MAANTNNDGTPYTVKVVRTVWSGGKVEDNIKDLPIAMKPNYTIWIDPSVILYRDKR